MTAEWEPNLINKSIGKKMMSLFAKRKINANELLVEPVLSTRQSRNQERSIILDDGDIQLSSSMSRQEMFCLPFLLSPWTKVKFVRTL